MSEPGANWPLTVPGQNARVRWEAERAEQDRPSLWFVVPAFGRVDLARICLTQHAWACEQLDLAGVDANVVVIADDENLDTAQDLGMVTIDRPNQLGAKYNDGYQLAASQGVDYVCALGSDSWIDPSRLVPLPGPNELVCTRNYSYINKDGDQRVTLKVQFDGGFGSRLMRTDLLRHCGYRPLKDTLDRGCDTNTLKAIRSQHPDVEIVYREQHPLDLVGFESEQQLSSYRVLKQMWAVDVTRRPFDGLADIYPVELVDEMRAHYEVRELATVEG